MLIQQPSVDLKVFVFVSICQNFGCFYKIQVYTCINICIQIYIDICAYRYICVHTHVHICAYMCIYIYRYMYFYLHISISIIHVSLKVVILAKKKKKVYFEYQTLERVLQEGFLRPLSSDSQSLNGIFIFQTQLDKQLPNYYSFIYY